jgi:hypothetical protein
LICDPSCQFSAKSTEYKRRCQRGIRFAPADISKVWTGLKFTTSSCSNTCRWFSKTNHILAYTLPKSVIRIKGRRERFFSGLPSSTESRNRTRERDTGYRFIEYSRFTCLQDSDTADHILLQCVCSTEALGVSKMFDSVQCFY